MPNIIATLVLLIWPALVVYFFLKYDVKKALFISFTLSSLILPYGYTIDFPLIPAFERSGLTAIAVLVAMTLLKKKYKLIQPGILALYAFFFSTILTALSNSDPLMTPLKLIPGMTLHDAFASIFGAILTFTPFLIARKIALRKIEDTELYFKLLIAFAVFYSIPMLIELRMSPFLHNAVYGYMPSQFLQNMRDGGFRPVVFYGHGLPLAIWFSTAVVAAYALFKSKVKFSKRLSSKATIMYMVVILVLCKTFSAMFYACLGIILLQFLKPSKMMTMVFFFSLFVLFYPLSKVTNFFPENAFINLIKDINPDRASSLEFRFSNEKILLDKALQRPVFGWGGWGRNRIYNQWKDITVTDGMWIIQLGFRGFVGFILYYWVLITPIYYAWRNFKYIPKGKSQIYITTLSYLLFVYILDTIPNDSFGPMNYFLAGALLGQVEFLKRNAREMKLNKVGGQSE